MSYQTRHIFNIDLNIKKNDREEVVGLEIFNNTRFQKFKNLKYLPSLKFQL